MTLKTSIDLAQTYPLDFTLQYPPRREYFQSAFRGEVDLSLLRTLQETLLYVHVPFCQAKCYFCNFAVDVRPIPALHQRYTDLLCEQLARLNDFLPSSTKVPGIDIGGGTPTLLQASQLRQILAALAPWVRRATTAHPLSIETTPRIAAEHTDRLDALVEGGVSRVSMGVQSMNTTVLAAVNRGAQENMTQKALANMRRAGFRRVNIDVIFALPNQTAAQWRADIEKCLDLDIDSITTYDCLYRGKGRAMTKRTADKPTPEIYGRLYDISYDLLTRAGFHASYGSVNFSRHAGETGTSPYFEGRLYDHIPYLGTGNYSTSQAGNRWWFAPYSTNVWMDRIAAGDILPAGDAYHLPVEEVMAKQVLLSLNYGTIDIARFEKRFGQNFHAIYGAAVAEALSRGWLMRIEGGYGVTPGHFARMPEIRALFYTPAAIDWVAHHAANQPAMKEIVAA